MQFTIYQTTNFVNGKIYLGKHACSCKSCRYLGSGKLLTAAIRKHGRDNFTKEILFEFNTEEEMNLKERELIDETFVGRSDTYNIGVGGEGGAHFKGHQHTAETKARVGRTHDRKHTEETKLLLSVIGREMVRTGRHNRAGKQFVMSEEQKKAISSTLAGRSRSDDVKLKISETAKEKSQPCSCLRCGKELKSSGLAMHQKSKRCAGGMATQ